MKKNTINVQENHDRLEMKMMKSSLGNGMGYRKVKIFTDQIQYHGKKGGYEKTGELWYLRFIHNGSSSELLKNGILTLKLEKGNAFVNSY